MTLSFTCSATVCVFMMWSSQTVVYKRGGSQCSLTASNHGSIYCVKKQKILHTKWNLTQYEAFLFLTFRDAKQSQAQITRINEKHNLRICSYTFLHTKDLQLIYYQPSEWSTSTTLADASQGDSCFVVNHAQHHQVQTTSTAGLQHCRWTWFEEY